METMPATLPDPPQLAAPLAGRRELESSPLAPPTDVPSLPRTTRLANSPQPPQGGIAGISQPARAKLIFERAGGRATTAAIERGLAWLVAHQHADGGWRFDLHAGPCQGRCRNSGAEQSTTAATGLALLPLLDGIEPAADSPLAAAVAQGAAYLQSRMLVSRSGGDLQEGTMYGQGLAGLALSRAYAQGGGERLREPAQLAIDFIVHAQHPAGGWRYFPRQAGDMTVVGWQLVALHAARAAGLQVPDDSLARGEAFLDSVQSEDGTAYGYQRPQAQPTATAIGLVCRLRGGWSLVDSRLGRGAERLAERGPSSEDMYYNYYAAQVLSQTGAAGWPAFRDRLAGHLIATQSTSGHEAGSWHFADPHTTPGGRLCDTALAILILQAVSSSDAE
jgi:hypothetical protein